MWDERECARGNRSGEVAGAGLAERAGLRSGSARAIVFGLLLATVGAAGACAWLGTSRENDGGDAVTIDVENNLIPPRSVTLLAAPEGRPQNVLGTVPSNDTRSFTLRTSLIPHRYRLIAELPDGTRLVSRLIQIVADGSIIAWNLDLNTITVERTGA